MGPLDGSIVSVALPVMSRDLRLSFGTSLWVQAVYLLVMAVLLIPLGRLADLRGRVHFYLGGIAAFTVGSLLAAVSMNGDWLVLSRVVQGVGASLMVATAAAIVTSVFPPQERGKALGINVAAVYLGLSVGPPLGGFLADGPGWRWIFLVNLPIGLLVLGWGWLLLPRDEREQRGVPRVDVPGSLLLGAFLVFLLVPLTFAPEWGWASARALTLLGSAVAALAAFVVVERKVRQPVLDLDLLVHNRLFAMANTAALLNYMSLYGASILTAVFLQVVQGRSAALAGWVMLSQPVMQAALSPLTGRLSDRIGSRVLTTSGMLLTAIGMALLAAAPADDGLEHLLIGLGVMGVGLAFFSAPNSSAIMGSVRRDQLGVASGFLSTMRVTGQALSVAVLGGIAAGQLGAAGARLIYSRGGAGTQEAAQGVADGFASGYRAAMITGACLAVAGALASLTRGPHRPR